MASRHLDNLKFLPEEDPEAYVTNAYNRYAVSLDLTSPIASVQMKFQKKKKNDWTS